MPTDERSEFMQEAAARRGLWRLMLKLPAMRGSLQILAPQSSCLVGLCEAYEDASVMLETLQKQGKDADLALLEEYITICVEIESDVIAYCLAHTSSVRN